MNTPKKGKYRWLIFKDGKDWLGVVLEFNIVISGSDPQVVEVELQEAAVGHIESAKKLKGFRSTQVNNILNQVSEDEFEGLWSHTMTQKSSENILSPFSRKDVYKAGVADLSFA